MKFFGHLSTVTAHRTKVLSNCIRAGIPLHGLSHDLSKFHPKEFWAGVRYYQGTRSPTEREREVDGYSTAWLHHKGRNPHHYEYWFDFDAKKKTYVPVPMPISYLAEMFCDRVAASKTYLRDRYTDDAPMNYFHRSRAAFDMHPQTAAILDDWLSLLAEKGERAAFSRIRACLAIERNRKKGNKKPRRSIVQNRPVWRTDFCNVAKLRNPGQFLLAMDGWICRKCAYGNRIDELSDREREYYILFQFITEMNRGGFSALFYGTAKCFVQETAVALKLVGASQTADLLIGAMNAVKSTSSNDFDCLKKKNRLSQDGPDDIFSIWNQKWAERSEDLSQLLYHFLLRHEKDFM